MKSDFQLKNKSILILSQQDWGKMMLSKHHYALELAKRGNTVFFLNPINLDGKLFARESPRLEPDKELPGFYRVSYRFYFPYRLKFHAKWLYRQAMKYHIKKVVKSLPVPVDIIWSFDLGNNYPFDFFDDNVLKIFHPVDEPLNVNAIKSAEGADVIFSVTPEILEKYAHVNVPKYHIPHGVSRAFLKALELPGNITKDSIDVGYSGNLLRPDVDRPVLLKIIKDNPQIQFHIWGSFSANDSNIGAGTDRDNAIRNFIEQLKVLSNVKLYGVVSNLELAGYFKKMDAFLICYDIKKDQSKGTNYHKILEYIAAGKIIISNNVTNYKDKPDLVQMVASRESNEDMPALFAQVILKLDCYNNKELMTARRQFAYDNTYSKHISTMERILSDLR